jgi:O-antigen/teichoic acid export membrane protein
MALNMVITSGLGFIFWTLAARFYPVSVVGSGSAIIAAMTLLANFSSLGLGFSLIRFLPNTNSSDSKNIISFSLTIATMVSVIVGAVFLAGLHIWSPALLPLRHQVYVIILFLVFSVAYSSYLIVDQVIIAKRSAGFLLLKNTSSSILRIFALIAISTIGYFGIFLSWGIAATVGVILGIFWLLRKLEPGYFPRPVINKKRINMLSRYSLANHIGNLLWTAPTMLFPLMIVNALGEESNAYFYIAWAISAIIFAIPMAVSASLFAEGSNNEKDLRSLTHKAFTTTILVLLPAIILVFGSGHFLLQLFGKSYSNNAVFTLNVFALSALPLSVNYIYLSILRIKKNMGAIIGFSAILSMPALVLGYFFMNRIGLSGVSIGWLIAQLFGSAISLWQYFKSFK